MKAIILAGGRATRLPESARDIPKGLVPIGPRPILGHIIEGLFANGLSDVRLALGFRAEAIINFLKKRGYGCEYVIEPEPLGTGGAVKFATADVTGPFMVLNGDILADFDFSAIRASHEPGKALLVSHWKDDARDFGLLQIDGQTIRAFLEKPGLPIAGHINAGCYILSREHLDHVPRPAFMLEQDVFPELAAGGRLRTFIHRGFWEDLGTEERLARVRSVYAKTNE